MNRSVGGILALRARSASLRITPQGPDPHLHSPRGKVHTVSRGGGPPTPTEGFPMRDIVVDPGCFLGLCASAIEAYDRETNGFLLGGERRRGRRRRPVAVLKAAYPIQTEERKRNSVAHGNLKAFDRARRTVHHLWVGLDHLGGYHSHTGTDGAAELSSTDIEYIEGELNHLARQGEKRPDWLAPLGAVRKRAHPPPPP